MVSLTVHFKTDYIYGIMFVFALGTEDGIKYGVIYSNGMGSLIDYP